MLWQDKTSLAPQSGEAPDPPVEFGEGIQAAWDDGRLFLQSLAGENARTDALQDHLDDVKAKTGKDLSEGIDWVAMAQANVSAEDLREQTNAKAREVGVPELSNDELEKAAVQKSEAAQTRYAAVAARERTFGGGLGLFLGGAAAQATDPINLAALPVAPEIASPSIVAAALRWGAIAGVSQAAIEATGAQFREEVQPGYLQSGAPVENVLSAAGQGLLLGGSTRALGNLWTRFKTGAWPQSVKDAGNVVESEANIADSNPYQGATGEIAHRTAMQQAIDSIVDGRPVKVDDIITGSLLADYEKRLAPVMDAISATHEARNLAEMERTTTVAQPAPELPFELTARQQAVERATANVADQLQTLARDSGRVIDRDTAEQLAQRVSRMSQDEALPTLDQFMLQPDTLRQTLPEAEGVKPTAPLPAPEAPLPVEPPGKVITAPDYQQAVRNDIDRERALGDRQIPIGTDANGNVIMRSLDSAMDEIDGLKNAADQIQACAAGPPVPEAEAA